MAMKGCVKAKMWHNKKEWKENSGSLCSQKNIRASFRFSELDFDL